MEPAGSEAACGILWAEISLDFPALHPVKSQLTRLGQVLLPGADMGNLVLYAGVFLFASVGLSHAYCSKPDAPYCASQYGKFDDQYDFDRCKSEMENFKSEVEDFLSCQRRENQQAIDDYNEAVESFNRRASGY